MVALGAGPRMTSTAAAARLWPACLLPTAARHTPTAPMAPTAPQRPSASSPDARPPGERSCMKVNEDAACLCCWGPQVGRLVVFAMLPGAQQTRCYLRSGGCEVSPGTCLGGHAVFPRNIRAASSTFAYWGAQVPLCDVGLPKCLAVLCS